jgi:hypothetical protein
MKISCMCTFKVTCLLEVTSPLFLNTLLIRTTEQLSLIIFGFDYLRASTVGKIPIFFMFTNIKILV